MARRRRAREIAFQLLYQTDLNPDVPTDAIRDTIRQQLHSQALQEFAWQLFAGVTESRGTLDDRIQCVAKNWTLKRMAAIDRNILRLGAYELFFTQTPYQVVIDEAIELAKRYGAAQSSQFVNGVLDRLVPPERRQTGPEPARPKD